MFAGLGLGCAAGGGAKAPPIAFLKGASRLSYFFFLSLASCFKCSIWAFLSASLLAFFSMSSALFLSFLSSCSFSSIAFFSRISFCLCLSSMTLACLLARMSSFDCFFSSSRGGFALKALTGAAAGCGALET